MAVWSLHTPACSLQRGYQREPEGRGGGEGRRGGEKGKESGKRMEKEGREELVLKVQTIPHTSAHLDVLDEVCSAVGNFLGCLHKVPLGHRVTGLAARNLARIAQDTSVFGNHCSCSQHLGSEILHLHHLHRPLGRPPLPLFFPSLPSLLFTSPPPPPSPTLPSTLPPSSSLLPLSPPAAVWMMD